MALSFFRPLAGDLLEPMPVAQSLWSSGQMHGVAVSAALARALESALVGTGRRDLRPARYSVDLFRPAAMQPARVRASVVREGPRLCLVDAELEQDGVRRARASVVFLAPSRTPEGRVWTPGHAFEVPPEDLVPVSDRPRPPVFHSDEVGWDTDFTAHQNASRKRVWHTAVPVVAGERPTAFQAVAGIADATSMVTNWGSNGVEFINTDITVTLARLPVGLEIGLAATDRVEQDGIAVGTAAVYDRQGPLGTSMVAALANARRTVDLTENDLGARSAGA
ncbi:MAG: acyl-CoA thioesterase domain-containing protein [Marmoricola sp.]